MDAHVGKYIGYPHAVPSPSMIGNRLWKDDTPESQLNIDKPDRL